MKKVSIVLFCALLLLVACQPAEQVPEREDSGFVADACGGDPSDYVVYGTEGIYEVGIKTFNMKATSEGRGLLESVDIYVKGDDPTWSGAILELSSKLDDGRSSEQTQEIRLSDLDANSPCIEQTVELVKSITDTESEYFFAATVKKAGATLVTARGTVVPSDYS